jgi:hypothetical protein
MKEADPEKENIMIELKVDYLLLSKRKKDKVQNPRTFRTPHSLQAFL